MSEAIYKFQPNRSIYLRGFDRRGCTASMFASSEDGFSVSGNWADLADFVVLVLFDADDVFGHLYTTKYLPDFDVAGQIVEFDLSITNGMYPGSLKFPSVPWGKLSWIKENGDTGTSDLDISSVTGEVAASAIFTATGTPAMYDRVQLIYSSNVIFEYILDGSNTLSDVINSNTPNGFGCIGLGRQINALHATDPLVYPLTASWVDEVMTVTTTAPGEDGNTIQLWAQDKGTGAGLTPSGATKLTGGTNPTSFHVTITFDDLGISALRQCWLTLAPPLSIDSTPETLNTLGPFVDKEFLYTFSNWAVTDGLSNRQLKVAGRGSIVVDSRDAWATFEGAAWTEDVGFYHDGFAKYSTNSGNMVTVKYSCDYTHDLYVGTSMYPDRGNFQVTVDGVSEPTLDTSLGVASPLQTRRLIKTSVPRGTHIVELTVFSLIPSFRPVYFDYLHAVVPSDVVDPSTEYSTVGVAFDYDTDQTYKLPPQKSLWIARKAGFKGDMDFYGGVFFALKRVRRGGHFQTLTFTITGNINFGNAFGTGADVVWMQLGGTYFGDPDGTRVGVGIYPIDSLTSVAQRLVNAINSLFVGVWAQPTDTPGELQIALTSPVNGFTFFYEVDLGAWSASTTYQTGQRTVYNDVVYESLADSNLNNVPTVGAPYWVEIGPAFSVVTSGSTSQGNEGTWRVDETQTNPLNRAFSDFWADFCAELVINDMTATLAWSQELLNPPDEDTIEGAWAMRFPDRSPVLTSTSFGSWGAGFIAEVSDT